MISPFARGDTSAAPVLYDHTSVLKMIEWRWGLEPLAARDAAANNIAEVLDLDVAAPRRPTRRARARSASPGSRAAR